MDWIKRKSLLGGLYTNAHYRGRELDPSSQGRGYCLDFELVSVELRKAGNNVHAKIYAHSFPSDYDVTVDDSLFDHLQFVYEGNSEGLESVVLERFGLDERGEKDPWDKKLLRFRGSKDDRELRDTDRVFFDWALQYCAYNCIVGVVCRTP